jgi:hypothetical protein
MEQRTNIGYRITDTIHVGNAEFVLGVHETDPNRFVTWECKNRNDYFWGHYFTKRDDAVKDLVSRVNREIEFREKQKSRNKRSER